MARGVIRYVERQRQVYLHDFIVYVCGVDISAYVKSLDLTYTDRNSPSSVDIVLTNPMEQWVLTAPNFRGIWRLAQGKYSEKEKYQIFTKKRQLSKQTLQVKVDKRRTDPDNSAPLQDENRLIAGDSAAINAAADQDFMQRYTFGPGSLVFSRFDTVKVFIKNPSDQEDVSRWIPAFTGTVEGKPFSTDFVTGASTVTLNCFDIRSVMKGMRIAINPMTNSNFSKTQATARTQQAVVDQFDATFFKDIYPTNQRAGPFDNVFAGRNFTDSVSVLLTGEYNWVTGTDPVTEFKGAATGYFTPGEVYRYANSKVASAKAPTNTSRARLVRDLEEWDNLCLFGTKGTFWTERECHEEGRNSFWTSSLANSEKSRTPMNGRVHWLIPADGLNITNGIVEQTAGLNNVTGPLDWIDRLTLLTNFLRKVDYEMTITGCGDFVLEFPLYDFYPENFGSNSTFYVIDKHVKDESLADESGDIVTALEVTGLSARIGNNAAGQATANDAVIQTAIGPRAVVISPMMASRYGVRVQAMTITGIAENQKALETFAVYEFQKMLADINKTSFNASYRPYLRPNRPVLHKTRNRIGKTTTVRLSFQAPKTATLSIGMHCVRNPISIRNSKGKLDISYQHVTGGAAMALSYNSVFENPGSTIANNNSGILVMFQTNPTTSNEKK